MDCAKLDRSHFVRFHVHVKRYNILCMGVGEGHGERQSKRAPRKGACAVSMRGVCVYVCVYLCMFLRLQLQCCPKIRLL